MLPLDYDVFFRLPAADQSRELIPGVVVDHEGDRPVVLFQQGALPFDDDSDILIYHMPEDEFMQQAAHLVRVDAQPAGSGAAAHSRALIELTGLPISAESRQSRRVPVLPCDLTLEFDGSREIEVGDVSESGLSVFAAPGYAIGQRVEVAFEHGFEWYRGQAVVQNVLEIDGAITRYGLHSPEHIGDRADNLREGLTKLTADLLHQNAECRASPAPGGDA